MTFFALEEGGRKEKAPQAFCSVPQRERGKKRSPLATWWQTLLNWRPFMRLSHASVYGREGKGKEKQTAFVRLRRRSAAGEREEKKR